MNLRPDERALEAETERSRSSDDLLKRGVKSAIGLGLSATGLGISSKIAPFLSQHIPTDLALKGISKIAPKIGDFLKKGMSQGLDLKEGINFLKDNVTKQKSPDQKNIIAQYDDKLHSYLDNEIKNGREPLEAAAIARTKKEFNNSINQIEKDHKTNWSSIIEAVYGSPQQPQQQVQQTQQNPQSQGPGNQALMALADKILKM